MTPVRVQMAGTQRSGSNLLREMLDVSSEIFAPPSCHLLDVFAGAATTYGDLGSSQNNGALARDIVRLIELNVLSWPQGPPGRRLLAERLSRHAANPEAGLLFALYDLAAECANKSAWVCKSLENIAYLAKLVQADPSLRVLYLLRDGRDVAVSFARAPIGPKDARLIARRWASDQRQMIAFAEKYPSNTIVVRYEDLIARPEDVISTVHERLGTTDHGDFLNFFRSPTASTAPLKSDLWMNLDHPVIADNTGKFRDHSNRTLVEQFEPIAFNELVGLGYEPLYTNSARYPSDSEWELAQLRDANLRARSLAERAPRAAAPHLIYEKFCDLVRNRTHADIGTATASSPDSA